LTIDDAAATTIVATLAGGDAMIVASEIININATIDSSLQTNNSTLSLEDENIDGSLIINLNAPILLGFSQVLTGDGSVVNVAATGSVQNGLDVAADGATVNLDVGTFQEGEPIVLRNDVTLNGGGAENTILDGAGLHNVLKVENGVTASINNLTIAEGSTTLGSGGIDNDGTFIISNSTVRDNIGGEGGGGIDNNGTLIISNSTISNNVVLFGDGGGINNEGSLTITDSLISGNVAEFQGGGISSDGIELTILNSTISENETVNYLGGGISAEAGSFLLSNSTVSMNQAAGGGGGVTVVGTATAIIENSTIANNFATDNGGGIDVDGGVDVTVSNSTISNNTADGDGGGLSVGTTSIVNLEQSTLTENTAGISGSGIANLLGGQLTLSNTIAAGNTGIDITGPFTDAGTNFIGGDPLLGPLADNGGPTQTHALLLGSPAIDAGSGIGPDQRGAAVVNGIRDIGAFEFEGIVPPPTPVPPPVPPVPGPIPGPSPTLSEEIAPCFVDCGTEPPENRDDRDIATEFEPDQDSNQEFGFVADYEVHLGIQAPPLQDFDALQRASEVTGVPPVLVYARFVPATDATQALETSGLSKSNQENRLTQRSVAEAEELTAQGKAQGAEKSADDLLELVLVTPTGRPQRFATGVTRAQVSETVRHLQIELTDRTRRRRTDYLKPAQQLYSWLVKPLEDELVGENIGHISFILDQGLRSLPLAALHDGQQFIIEKYSVGLMPSLSLTDTRIANIRNASVLAMGADKFSDQPALPAVPLELSTIEQLWPGALFLNESFTPEAIVEARQEEAYGVLHLATHGEFSKGSLDNSYIQFWDRRLSLDQLPQLQLDRPTIELLVLSACRTVLGDEEAELGFAGLAVKAGAKSAIATLWRVSDLETASFMAEFYTQLGQASYKAEALQQAQLAMLRGDIKIQDGNLVWSGGTQPLPEGLGNVSLADIQHPYYWSAFSLVGSPW
ncbi:MAG: CHAT domain-containing protein, partial [Leptolyngbya sp. SIO1D8]|nr:CHAT domain-containing protein [Leptolyngbya sp. SIO1D8]